MENNKKILFITESGFNGKYPRDFENARTDVAWQIALDANHVSLQLEAGMGEPLELVILIIPKDISKLDNFDNLYAAIKPMLKLNSGKFAVMQEGPHWYFQDYSINDQLKFHNILTHADFLLCHNDIDVKYFAGITGKPCYVMQSLMIEDTIQDLPELERDNVIIGGNFVSWYGGFDSYVVAKEFGYEKIYATSMGRMQREEHKISDIEHAPYMMWTEWIKYLNKFKYGVHLMRTHAAGTFALNCSYLGIPCIGYYGLDTQQILHPSTTVELGDVYNARQIAYRLKEDKDFYEYCRIETRRLYLMFYTEKVFIEQFNKILKSEEF